MTAPLSLLTLLLLAVGVSADAFAVAVGNGLGMRQLRPRAALRLAVAFGLAQAAMPLIGYALGAQLARYVRSVDHWVGFVLLAAVGLTMLRQAWRGGDDEDKPGDVSNRQLLVLSVATSKDALAVGIGFAFLQVNLLAAVSLIGVTTFALTLLGVVVGHRVGARFRRPAEAAGGLVLIGIGPASSSATSASSERKPVVNVPDRGTSTGRPMVASVGWRARSAVSRTGLRYGTPGVRP